MLTDLLTTLGRFVVLKQYGFTSLEYKYFYFYSDAVATIVLYFAVMGLYRLVFEEMRASKYIRGGAILLLGATACVSYMVVNQHTAQLTTRFVFEVSQNLYFVGVVLTYLLWGAVMKLHETRTRIVQLVLSLGIYFSASAGSYALRNLVPNLELVKLVPPLIGTFLPLAWSYTLWKIPEEARLAPASLVARPHQ